MLFGSVLIIPALHHINADIIIYSLLSLTLIRMLPVMISLIGKKLKFSTVLFLGWFGPRGLASILFGLLVLEESHLVNEETIFNTMIITVFLSVFAHGITANPLSNIYSNLDFIKSKNKTHHENTDVSEMPIKF